MTDAGRRRAAGPAAAPRGAAAGHPRRLRRDDRPDRRVRHGHGGARPRDLGDRGRRPTTRAGWDRAALMELEMALVDAPSAALLATAAAQPHDPGFVPFVRRAQAAGIPVEIVSDGFGFFIEPALEALGVGELPVITARTTFEGRRASIAFPNGHPTCFVCGTCKRNRVLEHQAAGRAVRVHRRRRERPLCRGLQRCRVGQAFAGPDLPRGRLAVRPLDRVRRDRSLARRVAGRLAGRSGDRCPSHDHPFFCGPEVWGEGLVDPPPGSWQSSD